MNNLIQDIRFGLRMLLKSPSISIVATIALALGIGANTAIFSVVNAVLLRPLPFPDPDSLVAVFETNLRLGQQRGSHSYPNFFDLRAQNTVFERIATYRDSNFIMTRRGEPARLQGCVATADLLPLLGVAPMIGRTFHPDEDKPSTTGRVVILGHALFQNRFGSDPSILNQSITLDGVDYTVVGVMPPGFEFPIQNEPIELWTTIAADASGKSPVTEQRGAHFLRVIGRLKPGITEEQAQTELTTIAARLEQQYPDENTQKSLRAESALSALVGDARPMLILFICAVAAVLLIACANVANLLLARATSRHKEMAIRAALGASRVRVIRQLLTESILLSLFGGAIGLLLAVWWSDLLVALGKEDIPRAVQVGIDWRVLLFTLGLSLLTGMIFGLAPAFHSSKTELVAAVALVLTIVGLYGVMSYSVAQRTNEIGIRVALGAQSRDVLLMVVTHGSKMILLGLAIGLALAFASTRWMASLLFGVTAKDPLTFAAVSVLLAAVALIACYVPAWRATKVDPMEALRRE